jgi:DNA-binding transcriptional ArsR family regulator
VADCMRALSHPVRLAIIELLVANSPAMHAGAIAKTLDLRKNTSSAHLSILRASGLIDSDRQGRNISFSADMLAIERILTALCQSLGKTRAAE